MDVNTDEMHAGAKRAYSASELANDAVEKLSRGPVGGGIFGGFSAAEAFQSAATTAHSNHLQRLRAHRDGLREVGERAHRTAAAFTEMEDRNAAALRSALWPTTLG